MKPSIRNFLTTLILGAMLTLSACAHGAWKTTYVSASTLSQLVGVAYKNGWHQPLQERLEVCKPGQDNFIRTKQEFADCMGVFMKNEDVEKALEAYIHAAQIMTTVLETTNPNEADRRALLDAYFDCVNSAKYFLSLLPNGEKYLDRLEDLL